ncbi:unnamed protein product [Dracunculus medinensis]|uniref:peptidylprolyl isomerase n=1 Tax=Dracunculus medinensis TaxID=318479 RepID=A0A0N4UQ43_DRAME|nr:unnamed protein product [Dracunculus medinensis]
MDGGVLKSIITNGSGDAQPCKGDSVTVHYVGRLVDGNVFDSSRDRNEPFKFELGKGQVIKGWDVGVATMKKGEKCVLTCRADYAYGESGSPPKIPANATLIFEVELLDFEGEDISPEHDRSIIRSVVEPGEKYKFPTEGSHVEVVVTGTHNGRVFLNKEISFTVGEATEAGLPEGIDRAIRRFQRGEKSHLHFRGSRYTYGKDAPLEYNLPDNAELDFSVFLRSFEKVKNTWEMTGDEKLEAADQTKKRGTAFLEQMKYKLALAKYDRVNELLQHEKSFADESETKRIKLLIGSYLNSALVYSKMGESLKCIEKCDEVLKLDTKNVKALYRKAQALLVQNDIAEALELLNKLLEVEPNNKAALQQVVICKNKLSELRLKERKRYKGLFRKLATEEASDDIVKKEEPQRNNAIDMEV